MQYPVLKKFKIENEIQFSKKKVLFFVDLICVFDKGTLLL
jgi:hypothetical protein